MFRTSICMQCVGVIWVCAILLASCSCFLSGTSAWWVFRMWAWRKGNWQWETAILLYLPNILYVQTWDWIRTCAVRGRH